jgi:hypothetical protein
VIKIKFKIYKWQRVTGSEAKQMRHCQWRFWWLIGNSNVDPTVMDRDQDEQGQMHHC